MDERIEQAMKIIEGDQHLIYETQKYQSVYMFTTENIRGILRSVDVRGKDILTVSASGDHIFNMLLAGAKNVESYDVNYFAKYLFYFKEAAVKTLEYKEFLDFFFPKMLPFGCKLFDYDTFLRVLVNIRDVDAKEFWKRIFAYVNFDGAFLYSSALFFPNLYSKSTYIACNDYLRNESNYKALQVRLANYDYKFSLVNIFGDFEELIEKKYDFIYLSNILDRIRGENEVDCANKVEEVVDRLKMYLKDDGTLGVCYLYCYLNDYWVYDTPNRISNPDLRYRCFKDSIYDYVTFNGIADIKGRVAKNRDALMLVRRKDN